MRSPLATSKAQLQCHFAEIAAILADAVDGGAELRVEVDWDVNPAVAGLSGHGCETIQRNRGLRVQVAPLMQLQQGLWVWLSYREEWAHEPARGGQRRFSFKAAGMTIHFGWRMDVFKPQMFRAEWAGWAKWNNIEYGFQAADAGHPHWQFDALDSLPDDEATQRAAMLRELIEGDVDGPIRDFAPQLPHTDIRDMVTSQKISRVHFASAAAWWKAPPQNEHAHGPDRLVDVQAWLQHSLSYLKLELGRLQVA